MTNSEYIEAYYVDPENGSDRNPGTFDRPFRSIQQGIDVAGENTNDSNQVYLKGGVYNLERPLEINRHNGDTDAFFTIEALPGENVILDGSQITWQSSLIDISNVRRVNIIGLKIRNSPSHGIEVVNGQDINLVNNTIHHTQGMGIRVRGYTGQNLQYEADSTVQSSDIVIEGNGVYFTNLSNSGDNKGVNNWGAGIQAWNAEDIVIVNNTVGSNYGEGIGLTLVKDGVVANNVVYDSYSAQIYLDSVTESLVENNLVYSTGDRRFDRDNLPANGIALANEIHNIVEPERFYLNENLIQRNVIVGADSGVIYGTWAGTHQDEFTNNPQGLKNTTITHNTVYDSESYSINFYADLNNENATISHNIFYQESEGDLSQIDRLTGFNFQRNLWFGGEAGDATSTRDITADPLFVNPGGRTVEDYQLQANSPAIDIISGDRNYRVTDNLGDLGALEYGEISFEPGDIV